jgi:hypothetical protein
MAIPAKQLNDLKHLLDELGLKYTDQDLTVIAYDIAKFVLANEVRNTLIKSGKVNNL